MWVFKLAIVAAQVVPQPGASKVYFSMGMEVICKQDTSLRG